MGTIIRLPSFVLRILGLLNRPAQSTPVRIYEGDHPKDAEVTIVTPVTIQQNNAIKCLESLKKYADFPSKFIVLARPGLDKVGCWCVDNGVEVWKGFLSPIILAKHWLVSRVDTEFCLLQDSDCIAKSSYAPLLDEMKSNSRLGTISPILKGWDDIYCGSNLRRDVDRKITRIKFQCDDFLNGVRYCDYSTISTILIRMEVYREYPFDIGYGMGFAHDDWFVRLLGSKWEKVVHEGVKCQEIKGWRPLWYIGMRYDPKSVEMSRGRFETKWGRLVVI